MGVSVFLFPVFGVLGIPPLIIRHFAAKIHPEQCAQAQVAAPARLPCTSTSTSAWIEPLCKASQSEDFLGLRRYILFTTIRTEVH